MIVEVTMSNIVVDSSAVNHGSKHISTGADPIPNATENAGGIVKLGATGVPSATKVPKALGADLVALITAAGYTLNPATGTASLDGIADGTTYKRVLAAIATALNASTIVAGTQWGSGNDGNGGQSPAPKPRGEGTGLWYFVESATTPNVSGAVYAVMAFTSAGAFLGALPSQAANTDISAVLTTTAKLFYYRTA